MNRNLLKGTMTDINSEKNHRLARESTFFLPPRPNSFLLAPSLANFFF